MSRSKRQGQKVKVKTPRSKSQGQKVNVKKSRSKNQGQKVKVRKSMSKGQGRKSRPGLFSDPFFQWKTSQNCFQTDFKLKEKILVPK